MFHMRRSYVILLVFLLGLGCIEDKVFPSDKTEQLLSSDSTDLDEDGIDDYSVYTYAAFTKDKLRVQRQVMVTTYTSATYTSMEPNLTDIDLYETSQKLAEFSASRQQSDIACSKNLGLHNVVCSDVTTCSRLCASASVKCKSIAATYENVLAGSMISYVQDNAEIRSLILDARRMSTELRDVSDEERDIFLGKTRDMVARVASINANPVYSQDDLTLCEHSDYGISYAMEAARKIGTYETTAESYHYRILFKITPTDQDDELGVEIGGVGLSDRMSKDVIATGNQISSVQDIITTDEVTNVVVDWTSPRASGKGYIFAYEFTSTTPPETALASIKTPGVTIKKIDLSGLVLTDSLVMAATDATGNYYMGLGIGLGISIALLIFIYNVLVLAFTVMSEKIAGGPITTGFRRAFGRTTVRWKGDFIVAVIFLIAGFYVSTVMSVPPQTIPPLLEALNFLLKSDLGIMGVGLMLVGVVMVYLGIQNLGKITMLERSYGMVIKKEKDMYVAKAASLKEKIDELDVLVENMTKEGFEVSKEYDVLSAAKGMNIDRLMAKVTPRTKAQIDDQLNAVESAVNSLNQKNKLAEENWPKWKENITKILEEQNEVFEASLVTIPAPLRPWAVNRYFKEIGGEGIVLEHNGLRKRKLSADRIVHEMILKGLIKGGVVIKNDAITASEFAEGSGTVVKALALKLRSYLRSLGKKLGQHAPQSFVSIGSKEVMVYMKGKGIESVVLVKKDKFNEAMEMWKSRMKLIESE